MTQLCRPYQPDSLSRDHMLHVADRGGGDLVSRLVLGVFIGVLLANATLLREVPHPTHEPRPLPTDAPPAAFTDARGHLFASTPTPPIPPSDHHTSTLPEVKRELIHE